MERTAAFSDTSYTNAGNWHNGPLVKETKQIVTFASATGRLADATAVFYLRSYNDNTHVVHMVIENAKNKTTAGAIFGGWKYKINGSDHAYSRTFSATAGNAAGLQGGPNNTLNLVDVILAENSWIRWTYNSEVFLTQLYFESSTDNWVFNNNIQLDGGGGEYSIPAGTAYEIISAAIPWGTRDGIFNEAVGGHTAATGTDDYETFYRAGAFPRLHPVSATRSYSTTMTLYHSNLAGGGNKTLKASDWEPYNWGPFYPIFQHGAGRMEVGLIPEPYQFALREKTQTKRDWMFNRMAYRQGQVSKHWVNDDNTIRHLSDAPTSGWYDGSGIPQLHANCRLGRHFWPFAEQDRMAGGAHYPDYNFVPYLLSGDQYLADEMESDMAAIMWNTHPSLRDNGNGLLSWNQNGLRGAAFLARNIGECIAYLPDEKSTLRSALNAIVANNNTAEITNMANEPDPTGNPFIDIRFLTPTTYTNHLVFQGLMDAYWISVMEHLRRNGVTLFPLITNAKIDWHIDMFEARGTGGQPYYCFHSASAIYYVDTGSAWFADKNALHAWNETNYWDVIPIGHPDGNGFYEQHAYVVASIAEARGDSRGTTWRNNIYNHNSGALHTTGLWTLSNNQTNQGFAYYGFDFHL